MPKIQFDVSDANHIAIDVANNVQIYFRLSRGIQEYPKCFNVLYIKIVLDKTKKLLASTSPSMGFSTQYISV